MFRFAGSIPFAPKRYTAQQSGLVRNNLNVLARLEVDLLGVAAAKIEMVPVEELVGLLNRRLQQLVPTLLAVFVQTAAAKIILILTILQPGMVAEFETGA